MGDPDPAPSAWEELATPDQRTQFRRWADDRRFGRALVLIGWLHLAAFSLCYYLTVGRQYHDAPGYLAIWGGELLGVGLVLWLGLRPRAADATLPAVGRFVVRVWVSYFVLAFNLCTMNTLRGHHMFELFPAMASLASFGFLVMTFAVHRRFFVAVLVMFAAGLLMSAYLLHAYLVFAVAWWLVLNGVGLSLRPAAARAPAGPEAAGEPGPEWGSVS